jgi:tRNA (guanine-N(7)-)-methyltransferase subunit TRM82
MTGKIQGEIEIWSTVQRFVKVEGGKGRGWGGDAGRGKQRKRRGKAKGDQSEEEDEEDAEELGGEVGPSASNITPDEQPVNSAESQPSDIIQVVHKIDSFDSGTGHYILFSATGSVFGRFSFLSAS